MQMIYRNGKLNIVIPDQDIEKLMSTIAETQEEAIEIWLDDNDYTINEEQEELDKKAKDAGVDKGIEKIAGERKPYTRKASEDKQALFAELVALADDLVKRKNFKYKITKDNKLIVLQAESGTQFKLDLIEVTAKRRIYVE